jgi:tetratricopeptide (TPR) repeat protein
VGIVLAWALADGGAPLTAEGYSQRIAELAKGKQPSEALRVAEEAVARFPDDAALHLAYGGMLAAVLDDDRAIVQFRRATELAPDAALAWRGLAELYLVRAKGDDGAAALARARALEPDDPDLERLQGQLDTLRQFRASVSPDAFPAGSAARVVADMVVLFQQGRGEDALRRHLDGDFFVRATGRVGDDETLRGIVSGMKQRYEATSHLLGVTVASGPNDAEVVVQVLSETKADDAQRELLLRVLDSDKASAFFPPDILETYHALGPVDRGAMFERMLSGVKVLAYRVELLKRSDWRVVDVVMNDGETRLSGILKKMVADGLVSADGRVDRESYSYRVGRLCGEGLVVVIAATIAYLFLRRSWRRTK